MNVGIIGDTHEPFTHPGYLDFCRKTFKEWKCKRFVHIGDVCDNHAISFHDSDPDGHGAGEEAKVARKSLKRWSKAFPKLQICIGNHDALIYRKANAHGLPNSWIKGYNEFWETPQTWQWDFDFDIDNVKYQHGTGKSGQYAHVKWSESNRQSTVIGHLHSFGGVNYMASKKDLIFGLNVGCGIDISKYAFEYAKNFANRPTLGCGVVYENGHKGIFIPMKLK